METRSLQNLSKDERKTILHELAEASLADYGLEGGSDTLLQDFVNISFQVQHEGRKWYLRIYNPDRHDERTVESELLFLEALANSGFPAPRPLRKHNDGMLWVASQSLVTDVIRISVCSWLKGELLQYDKTQQHYANVGAMLVRLHVFSAKWNPPPDFTRPKYNSEGIYEGHGSSGKEIMRAWENMAAPLRSDLEQARDALRQSETAIGKDATRYGLIHADPSFGNILFDGEEASLIDFDDCGYGHYVSDLAVVLAGAWGKTSFAENRTALLESYRQVREISKNELAALPSAMAARAASLIFWAVGQSPKHPWIEGQWQRLREYMAS
jgi:Ser/Thr protein kinase RdoA (MazF antagonist)